MKYDKNELNVVARTVPPNDMIYVYEYQKKAMDKIHDEVEGLYSYSDILGHLILTYQLTKKFYKGDI